MLLLRTDSCVFSLRFRGNTQKNSVLASTRRMSFSHKLTRVFFFALEGLEEVLDFVWDRVLLKVEVLYVHTVFLEARLKSSKTRSVPKGVSTLC